MIIKLIDVSGHRDNRSEIEVSVVPEGQQYKDLVEDHSNTDSTTALGTRWVLIEQQVHVDTPCVWLQ